MIKLKLGGKGLVTCLAGCDDVVIDDWKVEAGGIPIPLFERGLFAQPILFFQLCKKFLPLLQEIH